MKKCPNCNLVMNEVIKVNVLVDVCPQCGGVWLDRGELEKIIYRIKDVEKDWEEDYRRFGHYDDDYYKKKKKKWFDIFEIFD
ncbi:MAG: zf-TFIIB domain-containing protein [candidate division WOR-3 bacterium]|nr:zf-TFIIB domain-containing protein [candidate division WOR-3 bacterium]MCX7947873.1 zf-TFIIB domain-containing protein [candidate division WOR-3 bacterium]MDW8150695.1 zf-TFIIB domain-containing protein [candidate division WOR-3 bacterium]